MTTVTKLDPKTEQACLSWGMDPREFLSVRTQLLETITRAKACSADFAPIKTLMGESARSASQVAFVLGTLEEEDLIKTRIALHIPEHNIEQFYEKLDNVPSSITTPDGTVIRTLMEHLQFQWRPTNKVV